MALIAVSITVDRPDDVESALRRAAAAVRDGADLVEWRLDAIAGGHEALGAARRLVGECPRPCIVTVRSAREGGAYDGPETDRAELLAALCAEPPMPRYVDVEHACLRGALRERLAEALASGRPAGEPPPGLIVSSHDFQGRPPDLLRTVEAMAADELASVIKVAWRARSVRDNLEAFDLLAGRARPMIALCMGRFGLPSRVLAGKFGGLLTFATDGAGPPTAPGQPTVRELVERYRFRSIGPGTATYGVIGWPVEHSRSPDAINAAFAAAGIDAVYLPLPVEGSWESFKATMAVLSGDRRLDLRGASVTVPHKPNLVRWAATVGATTDAASARTGSANTLAIGADGHAAILDTDGPAALDALAAALPGGAVAPRRTRVVLLGAGGAARAIAAAFDAAGAMVQVVNRTAARAEALVAALDSPRVVATAGADLDSGAIDAVVNATTIGMVGGPAPDRSPLDALGVPAGVLRPGVVVMDTVYAPLRTPLVIAAEAAGATVVTGDAMFLGQAALQFEAWTGMRAPIREMAGALGAR